MAFQDADDVSVRHKRQASLGAPESGASGFELPIAASGGLRPAKAAIPDPAIRADGMRMVSRHGSRSVGGSYTAPARVGALDGILEDLMGSAWVAADVLTEADMTSITTTTNTIVRAAGSFITDGVKVGDVVTLADHSTAANNGIRLPVIGVAALTLTLPTGSLTLNAAPDSDVDLTVHKRLGMGTTKWYRTFEEYHNTIDQSETFEDCVVSSLALEMGPDAAVTASIGVVGRDWVANATGASPVLTAPTTYDVDNLVATDAVILKDGVAVTTLTGFSLSIDRGASLLPVIGSNISPDVFVANRTVGGSFSIPREDLSYLEDFTDETEFSLFFLLQELGTTSRPFLSVFVPVCKLMEAPDASLGGGGAMVSTMSFSAGKKETTTAYVETMVQFNTSAA